MRSIRQGSVSCHRPATTSSVTCGDTFPSRGRLFGTSRAPSPTAYYKVVKLRREHPTYRFASSSRQTRHPRAVGGGFSHLFRLTYRSFCCKYRRRPGSPRRSAGTPRPEYPRPVSGRRKTRDWPPISPDTAQAIRLASIDIGCRAIPPRKFGSVDQPFFTRRGGHLPKHRITRPV